MPLPTSKYLKRIDMTITKIVITGGPCAGKTTALAHVKAYFTARGYTVLTVAETATELISGGVSPWSCGSRLEYQTCQLTLQLEKERVFEAAAKTMGDKPVLIVCDRGAMDNKAYMTDEDFDAMLRRLDVDEASLCRRYGAVFHLVSAAKGPLDAYTTANNSARSESAAEAAALDDRIRPAWHAHPHYRTIPATADFTEKMSLLLSQIEAYLGV